MLLRCSQDFNLECIVDNVAHMINTTELDIFNDVPVIIFGISESKEYDISVNSTYKFKGGDIGDYTIVYKHPKVFNVDLIDNPETIVIGLHRNIREDVIEATRLLIFLLNDLVYQGDNITLTNDSFLGIVQEFDELQNKSKKDAKVTLKLEYPLIQPKDHILYLMFGSLITLSIIGFFSILFIILYYS